MKRKGLLILVIILVAAAAALLISRLRGGTDDSELLLSGNVEVTEHQLGFKIPGRITELLAEEGQQVQAGARLASIGSGELQQAVEQNRAALLEARAKLSEYRSGSRPQEVGQAASALKAAEADLAQAGRDFERAEFLYANGAIPAQQRDAARRSHDVARAQHRRAVESLSLTEEGPRREQVEAAEHRVRQAEAALKAAEERLDDTVIHAPVAGTVLRRNVELGETVSASTPAYTLGELRRPWVKVYVKQNKLGFVKLGQAARVSVDSFPGSFYNGTVTFISPEAEFTPKTVQTAEERVKLVFGVKVSVQDDKGELKPGMPADVRISVK